VAGVAWSYTLATAWSWRNLGISYAGPRSALSGFYAGNFGPGLPHNR
jgi:hypothetical protein